MKAKVWVDTHYHVGPVDRRIFSGFLEHIGRAVYEGIYDPGNPLSDANGLRRDVLAALQKVNMPFVRYPGGNYVSAADWRDGIGPKHKRPRRPDTAWKSVETNQFGIDEFMDWCKQLGTSPLMAVNLGTAGARDAAELLEYCNLPGGTYWADKRIENGHRDPYNVKMWCLGNEMDGPWQAGHCEALEYAQRATAAATLMKGLDPTIQTMLCGSSAYGMPTYMQWDRQTLEYCWDHVDYISAHRYSDNWRQDSRWFLAEGVEIDRMLDDYASLLGYVRGLKRSSKHIYLSFDEWNIWYKDRGGDGKWKNAPHLCEEVYNLEDAVVAMQYMTSFIRHADLVKVACIAQIVNVISPLLTRPEGVLLQSTYYPWMLAAQIAGGYSLRPAIDCPLCAGGTPRNNDAVAWDVFGNPIRCSDRGQVPTIDAAVTFDPNSGELTAILVNRSLDGDITVALQAADRTFDSVLSAQALGGGGMANLKLANTWEKPNQVVPFPTKVVIEDGQCHVTVPGPGFVVAKLKTTKR